MDWAELEEDCNQCRRCQLCETRTNVVFGVGNKKSEVMFVGEGPGETEDLKGEPFVGRAGLLLDDMLQLIGLDRKSNIYITNMVKCRPPKNRDPLPEEQRSCADWLDEQIRLINPKIIVCLGRISATAMVGRDFKITRDHGKWYEKDGVRYFAIYHPSALLRDPSHRPETFADLRELRRVIQEICTHTYESAT